MIKGREFMRRTGVLLVAVALGLAGLTGCSGGDDKYCGILKDAQSDKTMSGTAALEDPKAMKKVTAKFKEIGDAAPSDVQDEWKTMNDAMELATKDTSKMDPKDMEKMGKDLDAASKALDKDTKDRCGLELNLAG
jgi:hypothetical protein